MAILKKVGKKQVLVIGVGDKDADWIKSGHNGESQKRELAIHESLKKEHKK